MASDAIDTVAAINAAAAAIRSSDLRYTSPEQRRWKSWWSALWCFGSQKRDKQIVPTSRLDGSIGSSRAWSAVGLMQAGLALAPPSSPASFVNSSVQSPSSFTLSLSAQSNYLSSPGPTNLSFTIGPYAHETQLVSPPVFSTFTTEPSTAPFTPPPELAHITTPSSPDVPFAQLLASSLEAKTSARETVSPCFTSSMASPADLPCDLDAGYNFYPGSPVVHLILPSSGISGSCPDSEFPAERNLTSNDPVAPFPSFELFRPTFDSEPSCKTYILSEKVNPLGPQNVANIDSIGFRFGPDFCLDHRSDPNVTSISHDDSHPRHQWALRSNVANTANTEEECSSDRCTHGAFSLKGSDEVDWQIHPAEHTEVNGVSQHKEDFFAYIAEAAIAKREHIHEKCMQQVNNMTEGTDGFLLQGSPQFSLQAHDTGLNGVTEPELSMGLDMGSEDLQRSNDTAQWSHFETVWPAFGFGRHQECPTLRFNEKVKPWNGKSDEIGCMSSGGFSMRCSEIATNKNADTISEHLIQHTDPF